MAATRELDRRRLLSRDGTYVEIDAIMLGNGTSWAEGKERWFEVGLYALEDGTYVVHTIGRSTVTGERDLGRVEMTDSPYEVIEMLTVRRVSSRHGQRTGGDRRAQNPYLPKASLRALAQAAEFDDGINEAYVRIAA